MAAASFPGTPRSRREFPGRSLADSHRRDLRHAPSRIDRQQPGAFLARAQRRIFEANDWEIVPAARPAHNSPPPLCYSSVWLSMNCLVLDPKTVCVEASEVWQMEQLDSSGSRSYRSRFAMRTHSAAGCTALQRTCTARATARITFRSRSRGPGFGLDSRGSR